jgi:AAT family amino acid transporter
MSGFTGLMAWISFCWCHILFRRILYKAGYSENDLKFRTPASPYTAIIAIIMMLFSLLFLLLHHNETYKIAFIVGVISFCLPVMIYHFRKTKSSLIDEQAINSYIGFKDIFPEKK